MHVLSSHGFLPQQVEQKKSRGDQLTKVHLADRVHLADPDSPGGPGFTWLTHAHLADRVHLADPGSPG